MSEKKGDIYTYAISTWVDKETARRLNVAAVFHEEMISRAELLRRIIKEWLERQDKEKQSS